MTTTSKICVDRYTAQRAATRALKLSGKPAAGEGIAFRTFKVDDGFAWEPIVVAEPVIVEPTVSLAETKRQEAIAALETKLVEGMLAKKAAKTRKTTTRSDGLREGSMFAQMVDLALRPDGVLYQELLDLTGWKDCRPMFKKGCRKAGVDLRVVKEEGRKVRYFGTYASA